MAKKFCEAMGPYTAKAVYNYNAQPRGWQAVLRNRYGTLCVSGNVHAAASSQDHGEAFQAATIEADALKADAVAFDAKTYG